MVVSEQEIETAQDAGCPIIAIRNAIPATGYPSARVCHPLSEVLTKNGGHP
jgi:hypothetical protein